MASYWAAPADDPAQALGVVRRSYDTVAGRYAVEVGDELQAKPIDRALLDAFAEPCAGGTVADLGAGPGHVGGHLAARGARVVAVDLSPAMCRLAQSRAGLPAVVGSLTALPLASASVSGALCWYALIHLDGPGRAAAYRELARITRSAGQVLVAFHTSDAETPAGGTKTLTEWWDQPVELTFRFLHPADEIQAARTAGLQLVARIDREPQAGLEHPSRRSYLLLRNSPR